VESDLVLLIAALRDLGDVGHSGLVVEAVADRHAHELLDGNAPDSRRREGP
jgi:hypothetical protein